MLAFDDSQFSDDPHTYKWQWHAPSSLAVSGSGTLAEPLLLTAKKGSCAIHFVTPQMPTITNEKAPNLAHKGEGGGSSLQRIIATQKGIPGPLRRDRHPAGNAGMQSSGAGAACSLRETNLPGRHRYAWLTVGSTRSPGSPRRCASSRAPP